MSQRYQVVILGGGPVGLALAVELGQRGISAAVIERHLAPQRLPKGQHLTNRSLEHFYFWNCVDQMRAARVMPADYPSAGITAYDNLKSAHWYTGGVSGEGGANHGPRVADYYFQRNERLPQYLTEEVLRNRLKELPSVTALFGWSAERIDQDQQGAKVAISPAKEGAAFFSWSADAQQQANQEVRVGAHIIEADYIVGCDGGRSLVRETMGIERSGTNFNQRMVLAVFRSKGLLDGLKRLPNASTYRVLKLEFNGCWQFFGHIDLEDGFFFHGPVPVDTKADNYDFKAMMENAAGFEFDVELDHVGFWELRVSVAKSYRKDRAFIGGDAAHQHPPYGGQGLNNGLEDARNLGWKLAAKLQGWAGDRLLDSYGDERQPVFAQIGERMIAAGIKREGAWLQTHSPAKDGAGFGDAWAKFGSGVTGGSSTGTFEPNYGGSYVVMGAPEAETGIYAPRSFEARAGFHLAPKPLSNGRNVFEELGEGFTLLAFGADEEAVMQIEGQAKVQGIPLKVIRDSLKCGREDYKARLVLVRPDQFVAWADNSGPADTAAVLRRVTGN